MIALSQSETARFFFVVARSGKLVGKVKSCKSWLHELKIDRPRQLIVEPWSKLIKALEFDLKVLCTGN